MNLLSQKFGLCFGVANHRSIAWKIAQAAKRESAELGIVCQNERLYKFAAPLANEITSPCFICDLNDESVVEETLKRALDGQNGLDFLVHSIAFAPSSALGDEVSQVTEADFQTTFLNSVYSFIRLINKASPYLKEGSSICTLTYIGSERVVPGYGLMGPAKAALEASVRSLACEFGQRGIRINAVSAGPVKTLASSAIPGLRSQLSKSSEQTPLQRSFSQEDIADAVLFLLSNYSRAITGEVIHCDNGFHCHSGIQSFTTKSTE